MSGNDPIAIRSQVYSYLSRGWLCVPLRSRSKSPIHKDWPKLQIAPDQIGKYFSPTDNVGLILGEPSGWLVDVDLDCPDAIALADEYLPPTEAITGRQSAPRSHRWYIAVGAKTEKHSDPFDSSMIVELRSTGGQTVVGPSIHPSGERYETLEGKPTVVPALMLSACVRALADAVLAKRNTQRPIVAKTLPIKQPTDSYIQNDPQYSIENRAIAYLTSMPAAVSGSGGHSQTYAAATSLVHGFGLSIDTAFQILVDHYNPRCQPEWSERELRHKVEEAAKRPHNRPFGWLRDTTPIQALDGVDLSCFMVKPRSDVVEDDAEPSKPTAPDDPGVLPDRLLRVPGFINELMDHCLDTAPYPNQAMAFCGALALQATLAGRRVRDPGDNRTNLYVLGLAHSAAGKDWPRKLNIKILQKIGMADCIGERFASGEGIQDSLLTTPSMLFQTDEIDGLLQSINKARDARHEQIMSTLLTMYSSANSVYPMRRKAGKEAAGVINQPNLVIFGTAIPNHYYDALSERMLTNGLFARMLIFECGKRGKGQEPKIRDIPQSIIDTAAWWEEYRPGPQGNLVDWNPTPAIVPHDIDAGLLLVDARVNAEAQYEKAEEENDPVGTTVWGRVSEQTRKLALLHAVSRRCRDPLIDAESAHWAIEVVEHQTRRMLFMADDHVSRNDFDAMAKELVRQLRTWKAKNGDKPMPEWELTRRLPWRPSDHKEVIELLERQRMVVRELRKTATRSGLVYRLLEN
jgi:hypothetical protein